MLIYIVSRIVPKLLQIIGQVCAFDRVYLSLLHSFRVSGEPLTRDREIYPQETTLHIDHFIHVYALLHFILYLLDKTCMLKITAGTETR